VLSWGALPRPARAYLATVVAAGATVFALFVPLSLPQPVLFAALLASAILTATWKVDLPAAVASGSTLSVSYAADMMALLLLGPQAAMMIAVAGAWAQGTVKVTRRHPAYRTAFSMAAEAITIAMTAAAYRMSGGPARPLEVAALAGPLVASLCTYFVVHTGLIATAAALSTGRDPWRVWRAEFLWSGASFMVAGTLGGVAAVIVDRGAHWIAVLMLAPVYLTYRTYIVFTGRLELLEREQAARATAEQANRLKDQFLATVSHELRTPLNSILGWADMLRSGKLAPAHRDRAVHAVYESARRQAQIVDDLLDVSRIMAGRLRLQRSALDLAQIIHAAAEIVQPAADARRIRVTLDVAACDGAFFGDASRLQQIVWNLLTNAVKFTPPGGAVSLQLRRSSRHLELVVADTGEGIAAEFLPAVFDPFRQGDGSPTRAHGGLGLGLSIVKHLVAAHGGEIRVESGGPGQGSTFTVRLPIVSVYGEMDEALAPAADDLHHPASLEGLSVLLVDDDATSRTMVTACLEAHHAEVITAVTAAEALDLVQRRRVDVLVADLAMPEQDGYALIGQIRALSGAPAFIPAAALTAFDDDRRQALVAGFQLHLCKPIEARSLVSAVAQLGRLLPAR
jgi:signal transduction histidine kinase/CheY-like chemotaxis protein